MLNALVSVVIPTRHRLALLQRALTSAQAQTYRQLEIVVVVDGRDPETERYLNEIADLRVRVHALPAPVGGSDARNAGVLNARGTWIAFLDDDDEWFPNKIERQLRLLDEYGDRLSVIACKVIGRYPTHDYVWPRRLPEAGEPLCEYLFNRRSLFRGEGQLQTSMLLVSRDLMLRQPFCSGLKKHQDTDWYVRASAITGFRVMFVGDPLAVWYLGEVRNSIVRNLDWQRSWQWLLGVQALLTRRAFAGFIATQLIGEASAQGCMREALPFLLRQMFLRGRPRPMDCLLFLGNSVFRPSMRGKLRRILSPQVRGEELRRQA